MAEFIGFVNAPPDLLVFNWARPSTADRSEVRVSGRAQCPQGMYFVDGGEPRLLEADRPETRLLSFQDISK
jgi:hypothetical protein